jgi:hypothetical protein
MSQALRFGLVTTGAWVVALAWPLALSLLIGDVRVTLIAYTVAFVLDLVLLVGWAVLAIRYAGLASRGVYFEIDFWGLPKGTGTPDR